MKKIILSTLLLAPSIACPAPTLTSVDGLGGGTLSSALTIPSLTATDTISTDAFDATGEVTAAAVTAGAVTSSGAVTGSSLVVQRGGARVNFFGLIVGVVPHTGAQNEQGPDADGANPNYSLRQAVCAAAFPATDALPAAHACTVHEAMAHALQSPDTVPATASGAIVHTYGHYWFAAPSDDGTEQLVSDCGGMLSISGNTNSSLRLHKRTSDGAWSLRVENTCGVEDPVACCQ
jgi:hypothetical protein